MANVLLTLKIMPESTETNLRNLEESVREKVKEFGAEVVMVKNEPVAFGLVALMVTIIMDESKGMSDEMEDKIGNVDGVMSVSVVDVRRAIG